MVLIKIHADEIEQSKRLIRDFDANKGYNKFNSDNNYIGLLGEMVFHRYLADNKIDHQWVQFIKKDQDFSQPDFIINGKSIDLKTTYSDKMWFQKPIHDVYIYAQIISQVAGGCPGFLLVSSWLPKDQLDLILNTPKVQQVYRDNRYDNIVSPKFMYDAELLLFLK